MRDRKSPLRIDNGTLLWIGDRRSNWTSKLFRQCESESAQIAWRPSLCEAIDRRANAVSTVVLAQEQRTSLDPKRIDALARRHPQARMLQLLGPLCYGNLNSCCHELIETLETIYWHEWNQVWQSPSGIGSTTVSPKSVIVVADSFFNAKPLMDLAATTDAPVTWTKNPGSHHTQNFTVAWWDDSIARASSRGIWRTRIAALDSIQHVWITKPTRPLDVDAAIDAGIHTVVTKPFRIDALLGTIAQVAGKVSKKYVSNAAA